MVIFQHTFKKMLTLKFIVIYFIILIPLLVAFTILYGQINYHEGNVLTLNAITDRFVATYFLVTFMWCLGTPFLITTVTRGASLIQEEIEDDTLVLLISKPITRLRVLIEKWLASFAVSLVIGLLSISLYLTMYVVFFSVESTIIGLLVTMTPSLILYVIYINFIFTSIAMVITALFRNKTRSIIFLIIVIMLMQVMFPMFKDLLLSSGFYEKYYLFVLDINYHFGIMFYYFIDIFSPLEFTPTAQYQISKFMGIFDASLFGNAEDPDLGFITSDFKVLKFIHPVILFVGWTLIAVLNMFFAYRMLEKKDIA